MATIQGVVGSVTKDGAITSNGNFTCQHDDGGPYAIGYSSGLSNPVPVISLVNNAPGKSYKLATSSSGFTIQVYKLNNGNWKESNSGFDFVVGQIV